MGLYACSALDPLGDPVAKEPNCFDLTALSTGFQSATAFNQAVDGGKVEAQLLAKFLQSMSLGSMNESLSECETEGCS